MIADVDKDGSGAIDFDEFLHMMTAKIDERDTKEELTKAFQIIDRDKNVSLKSFLHLSGSVGLMGKQSVLFQYWLTHLFLQIFKGKISAADIARMAKELGENFSPVEIKEMIEEADRDGIFIFIFKNNGNYFNFENFRRYWLSLCGLFLRACQKEYTNDWLEYYLLVFPVL